jgi:hypothetical protein
MFIVLKNCSIMLQNLKVKAKFFPLNFNLPKFLYALHSRCTIFFNYL